MRVPVLVGEHDLVGVRRRCEELAAAMPIAPYGIIERSAHCPSLDQPDELNTLVLDFIETSS